MYANDVVLKFGYLPEVTTMFIVYEFSKIQKNQLLQVNILCPNFALFPI